MNDGRLVACMRRWQLEGGGRLDGGSRSGVFGCTTASGTEVVAKLAVTREEARAEAAALASWGHTEAAVRLIDADFEYGVLLLERVRPGTQLPGGDDPAAIEVAAGLLERLHWALAGTYRFPLLEDAYAGRQDRAREDADYEQQVSGDPARGAEGLRRLDLARTAAMRLCATTERPVLLHGDFMDKNLLRGSDGYVVIDPMPCIGDPCADIGFFAAGHPPAASILTRADAIAGQLGLDGQRAQRWAVVWTVLQTCQACRDDQAEMETCLTSSAFEHLLRSP